MKLWLLASLLTGLTVLAAPVSEDSFVTYDGYKVFRINTEGQTSAVEEQLSSLEYSEWLHSSDYLDIAVAPEQVAPFQALGLDFEVLHENLGDSIAAESAESASAWKRQAGDLSWYDSYHSYADHVAYFRSLQAAYPDNSELISSGTSYQGRDLYGLHLYGNSGPGKPVILYHGTVHAREWIAAPVVEYTTLQLLQGYVNGSQTVLDNFDFYIIPFVNPDGFVYTQTTNRLWRKNRQPGPASSTCVGRDINRNWAFKWNNGGGASTDPCSETYQGQAPSDSPENAALDRFARALGSSSGPGIRLFIDWHSYGQYILSPYGYSTTVQAAELPQWNAASSQTAAAIRASSSRRTTFTYGPSGATLYVTTGAAPDHLYAVAGADYSYTIELPDTGNYGFVLPASQIRPTVEELYAGQKVLWSLLD